MKNLICFATTIGAAALFAGCGGSQPPIGAPGAMRESLPVRTTSLYKVLHRFLPHARHGGPSAGPSSGLIEVNGRLYGTTVGLGNVNSGSVYSMSANGAHKVLYRFDDSNGARPFGTLLDVNGTLYGTTYSGGSSGDGVVFSFSSSGVETVLHTFAGGSDGAEPIAGLIYVNGALYGTTLDGGGMGCGSYGGCGTVYSVSTSGAYQVLYRFTGGSDGGNPHAPLLNVDGALYGTTVHGGTSNHGTVYTLTASGSESAIYSFAAGSDGAYPEAPLIGVNGTLYGTTAEGGDSTCTTSYAIGCGTVYTITTRGSERVLYKFKGTPDGYNPRAGLYVLNGTLYGTTWQGGSGSCKNTSYGGCGILFSLTTRGKEHVLHTFIGGSDGATPGFGSLVGMNGNLYGTTTYGGRNGCDFKGCGTAYELTP